MTDLRASDADRELVATGLRSHHAAGRLDDEELEDRLGLAYGARTRGELTRLVADLPPPEQPPTAPVLRRDASAVTVDGDADAAWRLVLDRAVPELVAAGYAVAGQHPPQLIVLEREYRPWWVWILVVALFPLGLLALLVRSRRRTVIAIADAGPGATQISVTGAERARVIRALGRG